MLTARWNACSVPRVTDVRRAAAEVAGAGHEVLAVNLAKLLVIPEPCPQVRPTAKESRGIGTLAFREWWSAGEPGSCCYLPRDWDSFGSTLHRVLLSDRMKLLPPITLDA